MTAWKTVAVQSPGPSGIMRVRPKYLLSCCMALWLGGALEGLVTQERHVGEEAQAFTRMAAEV